MEKKSHPFVRFLNLQRALTSDQGVGNSVYHADAIAILAYVFGEAEAGRLVTVSSVVRQHDFGSAPTVIRRLGELHAAMLIEYRSGDDKRHKLLFPTNEGVVYLEKCSALMEQALAGGLEPTP